MAKQSQLDKAIAVLKGERDILDLAIAKLEAQQTTKVTTKPNGRARKYSRRRDQAEGATTDSGNMNYPPA